MRQGLQLKISQQLTMTPQLQQAIKLLQLSTLELRQEVIEQLYNNPLLEIDEDQGNPQEQDGDQQTTEKSVAEDRDVNFDTDDPSLHTTAADASELTVTESEASSDWDNDTAQDLPVDANWDEVYSAPAPASSGGGEVNLEQVYQVTESLQGHLEWQLNLTPFSEKDKEIAVAFIDAIDDAGFIGSNLLDIISHIQYDDPDDAIEADELIAVLHRLQHVVCGGEHRHTAFLVALLPHQQPVRLVECHGALCAG